AIDRVRYVGEPIALVLAESRYQAEDALDSIEVAFEPLEVVSSAAKALEAAASPLHEAVGSNLVTELFTRIGDVEAAFDCGDLVVSEQLSIQRHAAIPLETRGLACSWDPTAGRLTVWGPTKVPHFNRRVLARQLDLPEAAIRFIEPDVGGGFGARGEFYP